MKNRLFKQVTAAMLAVLMLVSLISCTTPAGNPGVTTQTPDVTTLTPDVTTSTPDVTTQTPDVTTQAPDVTTQAPEAEQYPENGATKIVAVEKNIYRTSELSMPISVAHYENQPEILLIDITVAVNDFFNSLLADMAQSAPATIEETETTVTIERPNGSYCIIDFVEDTVYFSDFETFTGKDFNDNPHDLTAFPYVDEEGNSIYIKRDSSFFTPGYALEINLANRNIPLDIYEGKKYIPLQTFNDLFIGSFGANLVYNGKDLFFMGGISLSDDLKEIYYHEERTPRSEALAEFNFNELCLLLDLYYGLHDEHGFNEGFAYYLEIIGLKEELLKLDAINSFNALGTLTMGYIGDLHSTVASVSPYLGSDRPEADEMNIQLSNDFKAFIRTEQEYKTKRAEALGEVNFYQKVGNTAYITFDSFTLGDRSGGYSEEALQIGDTITMIIAAHAQISMDPEIENVVLDLSCNGGGTLDSAIYTVAWMLGSCELSIYNTITESRGTTNYSVDVNLDGVFDEKDSIADKNLYCIVSPLSFSCGNLVPALLKASGKVTIIGKTSGGGACAVHNSVTADGTMFSISSPLRMSTVKNGSYYSIDTGIDPDLILTKLESFYDRVALTEYINNAK